MRAHLLRISTGDIVPRTWTANLSSTSGWSKTVVETFNDVTHAFSPGYVSSFTGVDPSPGNGIFVTSTANVTIKQEVRLDELDLRAGDSARLQGRVALLEDDASSQSVRIRFYAVDSGGSRTLLHSGGGTLSVGSSSVFDVTVAIPSGYESGIDVELYHTGRTFTDGNTSTDTQSRATFEDISIELTA